MKSLVLVKVYTEFDYGEQFETEENTGHIKQQVLFDKTMNNVLTIIIHQ